MNVFIDTNIFLTFFHFSKDELGVLGDIFASHEHGSVKVHLTQQVQDEFRINREGRIRDALKRFKETTPPVQFPSFVRTYDGYKE